MHLHPRSAPYARGIFALVVAGAALAAPALAHAVVYPCTEAGVVSALAAGGVATFSCPATTTIVLSAPRNISVNGTDLDGGGRLILSGGGMRRPLNVNAGVTAQVRNVVLENGGGGNSYGGCLSVAGALTLTDSTVRDCTAVAGGTGVWVAGGGNLRIERSTLSGNGGAAEGVVAVHGTATLVNSTVSDNPFRSIVVRFGGALTLDHCTVVSAGNEPLFVVGAGDTATLTHTMLVAPGAGATVGGAGALISQGWNLFSNAPGVPVTGVVTGNQVGVAPLLGPLADNGGPTQTRALLACSPGINAGLTSSGAATDQRGQPRLVNSARDIVAVESTLNTCVTIDDVTRAEGHAGTTMFGFTARLSGVASIATQVDFASADGTATLADGDYAALVGTLRFPAGATTAAVSLLVHGDARFEPDETVLVNLSAPAGLAISDGQGVATITNDDAQPAVSVADVRVAEGNSGTTTMTFAVSLSEASSQTVTVNYATTDVTATVADGDYVATSGTLTFAPGARTRTVAVTVNGDAVFEGDETFRVELSTPSGATLSDSTGVGTITDEESRPGLAVGGAMIAEGNAGAVGLTLTVTLSGPSANTVTVDWATADGTATAADGDYVAAMGTLTFAPGATSQTVRVDVTGDTRVETDEAFVVRLSNAMGATIATAEGSATITNDDTVVPPAGDAGVDAAVEAGVPDAAVTDAGASPDARADAAVDGGTPPTPGAGCGCTAAGARDARSERWGAAALLGLAIAYGAPPTPRHPPRVGPRPLTTTPARSNSCRSRRRAGRSPSTRGCRSSPRTRCRA